MRKMITLKGLVLREHNVGETAKSITVLTAEKGVISILVRGGQKSTKNSASTQTFAYSQFCIEEKRTAKGLMNYYLNSSENIRLFYGIRLDAKKMALASYFAELLEYTGVECAGCDEVLRLTLNTFYILSENKMEQELLRNVFQFRLLCEIGLRPELVGCCSCFVYESDFMYFDFLRNNLTCQECHLKNQAENPHCFVLDKTLLYIVRFIALTDYNRLFAFRISPKYLDKLTEFTEKFLSYHTKGKFKTLEFYKLL